MSIWMITKFEEYNKKTTLMPFTELTEYQIAMGYKTPEEFFLKQAEAAQDIVDSRVGNILDRIFLTTDLPLPVQEQLKRFTWAAIDFIRYNDTIIEQRIRQQSTTYNNSRTDVTQIEANTLDDMVGQRAWRAWMNANIESLYIRWVKDKGIDFLLDPNSFYNKKQTDSFLSELEEEIESEHQFTNNQIDGVTNSLNHLNEKIDDKVEYLEDKKQNRIDQRLYQQETDVDGKPTGELEELGQFDELLILNRFANNAVITTSENKRRGVININADYGKVVDATTYQTSSETDNINPIGRQWAKGIENELAVHDRNIKTHGSEIQHIGDFLNEKGYWIKGQIIQVEQGTVSYMPQGWKKLVKSGDPERWTITISSTTTTTFYKDETKIIDYQDAMLGVSNVIGRTGEFYLTSMKGNVYKFSENTCNITTDFKNFITDDFFLISICINKEKNGYILSSVSGNSPPINTYDGSALTAKIASCVIWSDKFDDYIFVEYNDFNHVKKLSSDETIYTLDSDLVIVTLFETNGRLACLVTGLFNPIYLDDLSEVLVPSFATGDMLIFDNEFVKDGEPYTTTIDDLVFEYWRYDPNDEFKKRVNKEAKKISYWDNVRKRAQQINKELEDKKKLVTKAEVNIVTNRVDKIVPVVKELDLKEKYRMKKLGINPNDKYYLEEGDNDE